MKIDRVHCIMYFIKFIFLIFRLALNFDKNINHFEKYLQKTNDNIAINLIKILRLGPDVSFKGSPTVSPITAAL